MKVGRRGIECCHVDVRNFDTFFIVVLIQATLTVSPVVVVVLTINSYCFEISGDVC